MKLLIAILLAVSLTGCANIMHYKEWKPGQRPGLTFVSEHEGCVDRFYVGNKITFSKCF